MKEAHVVVVGIIGGIVFLILSTVGPFVWNKYHPLLSVPQPSPTVVLCGLVILVLAIFLLGGYLTWEEDEHQIISLKAQLRSQQTIRVRVNSATVGKGGTYGPIVVDECGSADTMPAQQISSHLFARLNLTVFNSGPPTILEDWQLVLPNQSVALAFDTVETRYKSPFPPSRPAEEFKLIDNLKKLSETPLETGQRMDIFLEFQSADFSIDKTEDIDKDELIWTLLCRDSSGTQHKANLIRKGTTLRGVDGLDTEMPIGVKSVYD
jgi:hypothetical protein